MITTPIDARKLIDDLDLDYFVREAARSDPGLDEVKARDCYRDFLYLCWFAANGGGGDARMAVICGCADAVWHEHILVTPRYRDDCGAIFGEGVILDHVPSDYHDDEYSGGEPTPQERERATALYQAAGVTICENQRDKCVWCVTGPLD